MKKSLTHLPKQKRDELARIADVIRKAVPQTEMIILFGSYARGDYKEQADLKPDRKSGHVSDYDILVITEDKPTAVDIGLWNDIADKCNALDLSAHVRIVAHDIQDVNLKLAEGQYFYTDVKKEGRLLYDTGRHTLTRKRKLKPEEYQRIAQDYFEHWFKRATVFYLQYESALKIPDCNNAAFNLHQATEAAYKAILLVFTNYNPNEHLLGLLGDFAAGHEPALQDVFPQETEQDEERFELLDYAYIGARYDPDYRITKDDLNYLSERVQILLEITERICKKRIKAFVE